MPKQLSNTGLSFITYAWISTGKPGWEDRNKILVEGESDYKKDHSVKNIEPAIVLGVSCALHQWMKGQQAITLMLQLQVGAG